MRDFPVKIHVGAPRKITGQGVDTPGSVATVSTKNVRTLTPDEIARVARRTRALIAEHGSQKTVGLKIGIGQQMVGSVAAGGGVGMHYAQQVAEFDRVPVEALLGGCPDNLYEALRSQRWPDDVAAAACRAWTRVPRPHEYSVADWVRALKSIGDAIARAMRDSAPGKR